MVFAAQPTHWAAVCPKDSPAASGLPRCAPESTPATSGSSLLCRAQVGHRCTAVDFLNRTQHLRGQSTGVSGFLPVR